MTEFVQFAADTFDHNIRPLHGHYIFHDMGMISAVTLGTSSKWPIPRVHVTSLDVAIVGKVQLRYHRKERRVMTTVTYQKFVDFKTENNSYCDNIDVLWNTSILCGLVLVGRSCLLVGHHHSTDEFLPVTVDFGLLLQF